MRMEAMDVHSSQVTKAEILIIGCMAHLPRFAASCEALVPGFTDQPTETFKKSNVPLLEG